MLSKEDTAEPEVGGVRAIVVLPAISRLYELVMLHFLKQEMTLKFPIHDHQRGFVQGKGCIDNLRDIFRIIDELKLA